MTQPKTFAKEMYGMDYDEKMKLLVALKDNPNESSAIIDTMTYQEKVKMTEPRSRDFIVMTAALRCSRRSP